MAAAQMPKRGPALSTGGFCSFRVNTAAPGRRARGRGQGAAAVPPALRSWRASSLGNRGLRLVSLGVLESPSESPSAESATKRCADPFQNRGLRLVNLGVIESLSTSPSVESATERRANTPENRRLRRGNFGPLETICLRRPFGSDPRLCQGAVVRSVLLSVADSDERSIHHPHPCRIGGSCSCSFSPCGGCGSHAIMSCVLSGVADCDKHPIHQSHSCGRGWRRHGWCWGLNGQFTSHRFEFAIHLSVHIFNLFYFKSQQGSAVALQVVADAVRLVFIQTFHNIHFGRP